ncbi:MAG: hypothetical protein NC182_03085 [Prevotella sp.]|nr:hypothetical protein [Staphylococcus sp.]MCM1350161.1 hypothetical protein [Prevotella sp.]
MKKICILFGLIIMLICSGCGPIKKPILEGKYSSKAFNFHNEDMKDVFSEAKVTIKEITKEEYEEANGINVFIDGYTSQIEEKRYLSIEIYLYSIETEQYEKVKLYDWYFIEGTQQIFHSKAYLNINGHEYFDNMDDSASTCVLWLDNVGIRDITIFGATIYFYSK